MDAARDTVAWPLVRSSFERRLVFVVGAVVFVDTTFYAVIAPLLPSLAHQLHLSKLSAGVLTASYAAGVLAGSIPGGIAVARIGPRATMIAGLSMLAGSTVAFALVHGIVGLDAARFIEGVGGACSWAGGLAWIVNETPPERRGAVMGTAVGAAVGGALCGPAIGVLATAVGRLPAFSVIVAAALALLVATTRLEAHRLDSAQGLRHLLAALRGRRAIWIGVWLVTVPAVASGVVTVLAPLRLHHFGAGAAVIGATFLIAAAAESIVAPATGRLSDRHGRIAVLRLGLAATAVLLLCFELPSASLPLVVLIVALVASIGIFWAPAMAMLSDEAEAEGLDQGLAAALINLAWAAGQITGAGAGGAIAKTAGDLLPTAAAAILCIATLAAIGVPYRWRSSV